MFGDRTLARYRALEEVIGKYRQEEDRRELMRGERETDDRSQRRS